MPFLPIFWSSNTSSCCWNSPCCKNTRQPYLMSLTSHCSVLHWASWFCWLALCYQSKQFLSPKEFGKMYFSMFWLNYLQHSLGRYMLPLLTVVFCWKWNGMGYLLIMFIFHISTSGCIRLMTDWYLIYVSMDTCVCRGKRWFKLLMWIVMLKGGFKIGKWLFVFVSFLKSWFSNTPPPTATLLQISIYEWWMELNLQSD